MPEALTLEKAIEIITDLVDDEEDAFFRTVSESGLSARQARNLETIHGLENPTPGEIADKLGISKPSVTAIIAKLEKLGLLRKVKSDEDRREYHVHSTEKAKKIIREHRNIHRRIAKLYADVLQPSEVDTLIRLIEKVIHRIA